MAQRNKTFVCTSYKNRMTKSTCMVIYTYVHGRNKNRHHAFSYGAPYGQKYGYAYNLKVDMPKVDFLIVVCYVADEYRVKP